MLIATNKPILSQPTNAFTITAESHAFKMWVEWPETKTMVQ